MTRHRSMTTRSYALILAAAGGLVACDSSASSDYQGKTLARIRGLAVLQNEDLVPPDADAMLVWVSPGPGKDELRVITDSVPVKGKFPAEFTLDLHHPPPPSAGIAFGDTRISIAVLMAFRHGTFQPGTQLSSAAVEQLGGSILGLAEKQYVAYLDRDLTPDHPLSVYMGGLTRAGYHVMRAVPLPQGEVDRRQEACRRLGPEFSPCDPEPEGVEVAPGNLDFRITLVFLGPGMPTR